MRNTKTYLVFKGERSLKWDTSLMEKGLEELIQKLRSYNYRLLEAEHKHPALDQDLYAK